MRESRIPSSKRFEMAKKYLAVLFACLTVLMTGYIFSNSAKDAEASHAQSDAVLEIVKPILSQVIPDKTDTDSQKDLAYYLRKAAHFAEFAALGFCAGIFAAVISAGKKKSFFAAAALYCLGVACCDEIIQSFTDRTSSVKDVVLDFSGAMFGVLLAAAAVWLLHHKRGGNAQCPN